MTITNAERRELGERIDRFMTQLSSRTATTGTRGRAQRGNRAGTGAGRTNRELPAGTEVDVRLHDATDVRRRSGRRPS